MNYGELFVAYLSVTVLMPLCIGYYKDVKAEKKKEFWRSETPQRIRYFPRNVVEFQNGDGPVQHIGKGDYIDLDFSHDNFAIAFVRRGDRVFIEDITNQLEENINLPPKGSIGG